MEVQKIYIETYIGKGIPNFKIVGLPDKIVNESRERIISACRMLKIQFPYKKIVVNLVPADLRKDGSHLDLPIFVSILLSESFSGLYSSLLDTAFIGEINLNGSVVNVKGILPLIIKLKEEGINKFVIPLLNMEEANLIENVLLLGISSILEIDFTKELIFEKSVGMNNKNIVKCMYDYDFKDVLSQEALKRVVQIAACGRHNILLLGEPGIGKTMVAKRVVTILPKMNYDEIISNAKIFSLLDSKFSLETIAKRPVRMPHSSVTKLSMIGGGKKIVPGEITLANNGILLLDEILEYKKEVLESLRIPIEDKCISLSRLASKITFLSDFLLVATSNPCPCGHLGSDNECTCSEREIKKYKSKLSGPMLDRIDIQYMIYKSSRESFNNKNYSKSSNELYSEISKALLIQQNRFSRKKYNGNMTSKEVEEYCVLNENAKIMFDKYIKFAKCSFRSINKILKISRTIADIDGEELINELHISEAISLRNFDGVGG
ncbi:YifB family Mg chelatase-like AAA ATPase [Helicovermis profundi]|uniref:YifB family Mg chelatase-like AAA ATPase n=1 Tax=Helicovermis profundi TaxID=3065157 RepID=A0AAU9EDE9_9FIRM|nr:YifB family Mg chelatase-like AAA ATPase [Clostridia bacterium S502]